MKKIIIFSLIFIVFYFNINAHWDLNLNRNVSGKTTMKLISVPFEGLNRYTTNPNGQNRINLIFNGPIHRRFIDLYYHYDNSILFFSDTCSKCYLSSCFAEVIMCEVYGFGKYLIKFENFNNPGKNISFIFNTLDSKSGMDSVINGRPYHSDWNISYYDTLNTAFVTIDNGDTTGNYRYIDTVFLGEYNREINYWYAYWRINSPLERKFYARTTPFPLNPFLITLENELYDVQIGTTIIFDTVYRNFGDTDRFGYNTVENNGPNNYYFNPPIPGYTPDKRGNTFTTPAYFYSLQQMRYGMKITAISPDTIILKKNKYLWIAGQDYQNGGDTLLLLSGSTVIQETGSQLNTYNGGIIIDSGCSRNWFSNSSQRICYRSELIFAGLEHLINNNSFIQIDSLAKFRLGNNTTVTFDGAGTYLKLNPNANVILSVNAKIVFKNGARLIANGSNFYTSGSSTWQGLVFENSGQDTIINCTFSNAVLPVEIKNNNPDFYFVRKVIKGNKFNIPSTGIAGIKTNNALNLLIEADTISINSGNNGARGIYIINSSPADNYGDSESDPSNIIIAGNKITNGVNSIIILNNTTNLLPVYVGYNNCTGAKSISFIGRLMRGIIRGNTFDNHSISDALGISINQSQPNLALNSISSNGISIKLFSNSNPNLAPLIKDNTDLLWTGGGNVISSLTDNTIEFYQYSLAITDRGNNNFIKNSSLKKHLNGYLNIDSTSYNARYNCWNSVYIPEFNLVNIDSLPVTVIFQSPGYNCNQEIVQTDLQIDYWGAGIYDTTIISDYINSDTLGNDEILFGQGTILNENSDYPNAIENFKSLINTYFSSQYAVSSIYSLYESYSGLDTSSVQSNRDILFGNLKTYLEQKIQSGNYDDEFNDNAFYMIVICEANMYNKQLAVDDYEFLSLYHPLPEIRVLASWDYTEMIALFGEGGSKREYNSDNEIKTEIKKISKRIEKRFAGDPVRNKILKIYQKRNDVKRNEEMKINSELNKNRDSENKELLQRKKDIEQIRLTENIAARNLLTLRNMDEAKKEEKRYDDLMLVSGVKKRIAEKSVIDNITPGRYELSQNYPNPFNPVTNIQFDIPKEGLVTLKVYDILGREVRNIVSEFKQAGSYIVSFDGSELASGIYFYRLESGNFVQVKRMIILK